MAWEISCLSTTILPGNTSYYKKTQLGSTLKTEVYLSYIRILEISSTLMLWAQVFYFSIFKMLDFCPQALQFVRARWSPRISFDFQAERMRTEQKGYPRLRLCWGWLPSLNKNDNITLQLICQNWVVFPALPLPHTYTNLRKQTSMSDLDKSWFISWDKSLTSLRS